MFLDKLELSNEEIEKKEQEFSDFISDVSKSEAVFKELQSFFADLSLSESIKKYGMTYWRWYVWLTWDRLNSLKKEELVSVFGSQVPVAFFLDFDVFKCLMEYFISNNYFEGDLDFLYVKVKKSFQESQAIIGVWGGKDVTVAELVKEIKLIGDRKDSLEQAEFESQISQIFFPNNPLVDEYVLVDFDKAVQRFVDLVMFFQIIDENSIWVVVNNFINSKNFKNVNSVEEFPVSKKRALPTTLKSGEPSSSEPQNLASKFESMSKNLDLEIEESKKQEEKPITPAAPVAKAEPEKPVIVKQTPQEKPVVEPQARLSTAQIKSQIESEFKKDIDGNFINIEGVMRKLEEFTEMYNDPKIADLIYYDEEDDKFKWKV